MRRTCCWRLRQHRPVPARIPLHMLMTITSHSTIAQMVTAPCCVCSFDTTSQVLRPAHASRLLAVMAAPLRRPVRRAAMRPTFWPGGASRRTVEAWPICWWLPPPWGCSTGFMATPRTCTCHALAEQHNIHEHVHAGGKTEGGGAPTSDHQQPRTMQLHSYLFGRYAPSASCCASRGTCGTRCQPSAAASPSGRHPPPGPPSRGMCLAAPAGEPRILQVGES